MYLYTIDFVGIMEGSSTSAAVFCSNLMFFQKFVFAPI